MLLGIFSLGVLVILCAILNRYYNFTGGFGDLSYVNWYAGETSTAVIVVNVPHLWPLINRLLSFRSSTAGLNGSNKHHHHRFPNGKVSRGQGGYEAYIRSESEERIAWTGKGHEVEMGLVEAEGKGYTAKVEARRKTLNEEVGGWGVQGHHEHQSGSMGGEGIVKTVY